VFFGGRHEKFTKPRLPAAVKGYILREGLDLYTANAAFPQAHRKPLSTQDKSTSVCFKNNFSSLWISVKGKNCLLQAGLP
jgi:hypothetical protein